MCQIGRLTLLLSALPLVPLLSFTQLPTCQRLKVWDTYLPTYPLLARAAHMSATIRFTVEVTAEGTAQLSFLDGPSKGAWQTLVQSAHDYLSARKYQWPDGERPQTCRYIASVEFRETGQAMVPPNNFFRVTVEDETRTVLKVRPTVPAVMH